ncbi:MAG TPA: hypothetical protein VHL34_17335, partial [Rhizomicrobium sp.]|nr:hypothetical protein [Rhizomicrobium sp.]
MTIWTELDIAPTDDAKLIRRAYATRLRAIDPDANPVAFQNLRTAYDRALTMSARAAQKAATSEPDADTEVLSDEEDEDDTDAPLFQPAPEPPRELTPEEQERATFETDVNTALAAGDSRTALALLTSALARGLITLGNREYALQAIMPVIVRDGSLSPEEYLAALEKIGWNSVPRATDPFSQVRHAAISRANAERWFQALRTKSEQQPWPFAPYPDAPNDNWFTRYRKFRIANLLLHGTWCLPRASLGVAMLGRELDLFHHHAGFIRHRFDERYIARAESIHAFGKSWRRIRLGLWALASGLMTIFCIFAAIATAGAGIIGVIGFGRLTWSLIQALE